ncbi:MAG: hypothetical protein ACU85V_02355 [Gammaproteobacteria bacterium]
MINRPGRADLGLLVLVLVLTAVAWRVFVAAPAAPEADARRYLAYSASLLGAGVFGLDPERPTPGRANTPLYPAFVAAVLELRGFHLDALRCHLERGRDDCSAVPIDAVVDAQAVVLALSLAGIWLLAFGLLGRRGAWLALAFALVSGQPGYFAERLLTENFSILLMAWLGVLMLFGRASPGRMRYPLGTGLLLGALALNRPEFLYLAGAFLAVAAVRALAGAERRSAGRYALLLALGVALVCAPWMARNALEFGSPALTASYGGRILAQRVRYNQMGAEELGVAFVYWLPDFGDSLAAALFAPATYARLDFSPGSYYSEGRAFHDEVAAQAGGEAFVVRTLLVDHVLSQPLWHAATTAALAWRAVFVGKLWGLLALLAFGLALVRGWPSRGALFRISLPCWFMLAFYAAVSVSVPRYAVCFVPVFSVALAALLTRREGGA